jgi:iron complex outermembrane receptor protein
MKLYLHEAHQQLEGVNVVAHKQVINMTTTVHTVSGLALDKTRGGSLADAIQSIPGVRMLQTGSTIAKPVINGMWGSRVPVFNNGIRQEGQQWGAEHAPEIDPFIAQQITVVKGAESVRVGQESMGGVVLLETAPL